MKAQTTVHAEEGKQELFITRSFSLPAALLFRAHVEPALVAQWMGTNVLKLEAQRHGAFLFETPVPGGGAQRFHGVIHALEPERQLIRTFEIEGAPFGPQLEFLTFEALAPDASRLSMQIVFRSAALRDQLLQLPFARGIDLAHNRLQAICTSLT